MARTSLSCIRCVYAASLSLRPESASRTGRALFLAFVRNIDRPAAVFAMHGVEIMTLEPAVGTGEAGFRRPEDGLREAEEQRYTYQHDADGEQAHTRTGKRGGAGARARREQHV